MRKEKGRNYHPYYAVGDFNGDGREDFARRPHHKKKRRWKFGRWRSSMDQSGPRVRPRFSNEQSDLRRWRFLGRLVGSSARANVWIAGTFE